MGGCERQPLYSACLKPPEGESLVLNEGETWIGRGSFSVSIRAQLLCSRRQACFKWTATGLVLECHGINPLLFVVCHSRNFHGTEETPAAELFQLRKGESVQLTDGDQLYFAAMECLLTIVIGHNNVPISRDAMELPLERASTAQCVKGKEELQDVEILREAQGLAEICGTSEPPRFLLTNGPTSMCADDSVAAHPGSDWQLLEAPGDGSVRIEQGDSDSLGLDVYDCEALGVGPIRREEMPEPAVRAVEIADMNGSHQSRLENFIEEAVTNSVTDKGLDEVRCPDLSFDGEGCRPPNGGPEGLRGEASAAREQSESQDYNPIMSSETADGRVVEDELILYEPVRGLAMGTGGDCLSNCPDLGFGLADDPTLSRSRVSGIRDGRPEKMEEEAHPEVSGMARGREDDPVIPADVEDKSWPDGPVEGMESVIASVSGYEGVEKRNLVNLINKTGAAFTGAFSDSNTHLVCWNFHGKKFDKAMKLHKVVVNHQWFEDCLRAGKRLSDRQYRLRSGQDAGPLKWKETPPLPQIEQAEASNGASNQKDLPGPSRQAGVANVEAGETGGRKFHRLRKRSCEEVRVDPLTLEQENLVGKNPSVYASRSGRAGESYQRRTGEFVGGLEQDRSARRRKSGRFALHDAGQVQGHDTKGRNSASSVLGQGIDGQEQGVVSSLRDNLTGRGGSNSSGAPDRELAVINLADDVTDDVSKFGLRIPQAASAQATEDMKAETSNDRSLQVSQPSKPDEVACAICLVDAMSPSEGMLECGHKFCYKCIFKWSQQAVKGPSCPLCKSSCDFITRREVSSSGRLDETVVVVGKKEIGSCTRSQRSVGLDHICIQCGNSDSESLLMRCGTCSNRAIHNFCMDPPAPPPWFCPGCTHGHQRESMRMVWNQILPGPSTATYADSTREIRPVTRPSNVRRRNTQPYTFRRPCRRNVAGQNSLRSHMSNNTSNGDNQ